MNIRLVESLCLSVCDALTFESLDLESSFFGMRVHLQVTFLYPGHRVKVKATRAKNSDFWLFNAYGPAAC